MQQAAIITCNDGTSPPQIWDQNAAFVDRKSLKPFLQFSANRDLQPQHPDSKATQTADP